MSSEVDIVNLALANLGDSATVSSIDPPEGSAQAEHCARFYPIARDALLEMHGWKFATRRTALATLAIDTWNWQYAYSEPAEALRILAVLPATAASDDESQDFETESGPAGESVIYTNQDTATVRYIVRVTDTTKFSPLFVDCLARLLSSYLAGPILKGDTGIAEAKSQLSIFRAMLIEAKASDANQRKGTPTHTPDWIGGR